MLNVFVSSTFRDLKKERKLLIDNLNTALTGVGMESFIPTGSDSGTSQEISIKELRKSDIVIFLVSPYYGSPIDKCKIKDCKAKCLMKDKQGEISYTHCEYKVALAENKHYLPYIVSDREWKAVTEMENWKEIDWSKAFDNPDLKNFEKQDIEHYFKVKNKALELRNEVRSVFCQTVKNYGDIETITDHLATNIIDWYSEGKINLKNFCGRRGELKELLEKMNESVEVYGVGGIGKTTLIHVALLIEKLQGKNIVTVGTRQSYLTGSGYELFRKKCEGFQYEILGEKITLGDIMGALNVPDEVKIREKKERLNLLSGMVEKENIVLFIDDFHLADDEVKEFVKNTHGVVVSSKKKTGITRNEIPLYGIDEKDRLIDLAVQRFTIKNLSDIAREKIKELAEGHPVSTEILVRNYKNIGDFRELKEFKSGLDFSKQEHVEEFMERVVREVLSKESFNLLENLSVINTEMESNLNRDAIKETYNAGNEIFNELIDAGMLETKEGEEGIYWFSYRHIQDALAGEDKETHQKAVEYYLNKIKKHGGNNDDYVEIIFHLSRVNPDKKLIDAFLDLNGRLSPVHYGFKRLIDVGEELRNLFKGENKAPISGTLGNLYSDLGRFKEAEESYGDALKIYKKLAEENPDAYLPDVATTQNNLGNLYSNLGRFKESEESYGDALKIYKKLAEENPDAYLPDVAMTQNNLGILYSDLGRFEEAEKAYGEALGIRKKLAEENPDAYLPDVATTQNNLGALYIDLGRFKEAEDSYGDALKIRKKLAEENPDAYLPYVATTQNNLGILCSNLGRFEEAEKAYGEALGIYKKLAEENPDAYLPDVATTQNNLGALYSDLGRFKEAEESYGDALKIRKKLAEENPGAYLPVLLQTQANIGIFYINTRRIEKGIGVFREVLERRDLLPDFGANVFANLGKGYEKLKKHKEASQNYLFASACYFFRFKQGVPLLNEIVYYLKKAAELGEGEIKGDALLALAALNKLSGGEVEIPDCVVSKRGNALKEALNGRRVEFKGEGEVDLMAGMLVEELLK
ncbi:hypothetical protein BEH94_05145 [Candidatus Altiarchaeales archaeon WOR_SM1_SCG]|nr:hypothetical protein BEH94_05145 [Candidatus Altiarchaeales archaeon WOR_SM1_SCG]